MSLAGSPEIQLPMAGFCNGDASPHRRTWKSGESICSHSPQRGFHGSGVVGKAVSGRMEN